MVAAMAMATVAAALAPRPRGCRAFLLPPPPPLPPGGPIHTSSRRPPRPRLAGALAGQPWDDAASAAAAVDPAPPPAPSVAPLVPRVEVRASSGLSAASDLPLALDAVASACEDFGFGADAATEAAEAPRRPESVPGASGRVLLLGWSGRERSGFDGEEMEELSEQLRAACSERIDAALHEAGGQPILLAFDEVGDEDGGALVALNRAIEREVADYGLRDSLGAGDDACGDDGSEAAFVPSFHVEIDGATIHSVGSPGETRFDVSSVLVFDDLIDDSLRRRLLNVVKGYPEDGTANDRWDDTTNGPDPGRWARGGLVDVAGGSLPLTDGGDDTGDDEGSSWGLTDDAVLDLCFGDHTALAEFEAQLVRLFPDFLVTRLPEAVLGAHVSPLTANAPAHGDVFDYHIDADPLQVPPSPWADVYGRYPNRDVGKPRFVSCLVYPNDEWDAEAWGAPTRFLDPPTGEAHDVHPKPGRCVVMDQDVSHTVVAPNAEAGRRPRYSLVWKLILHPRKEGQDMADLPCGRGDLWPEPIVVGSARNG
ncbi:hypothetical protein ACHAWF_002122 [Thalassiosira exigua]